MRQSLLHLYIPNPIYGLNHDGDWRTSPTVFLVFVSCPQPELLSSVNYSSFFPVQTPSPLSSGSSEPMNAFFPSPQSLTLTNENLAFMTVIISIILKQWFLTLAVNKNLRKIWTNSSEGLLLGEGNRGKGRGGLESDFLCLRLGFFENKYSSFLRSWSAAEALESISIWYSQGEDGLEMKREPILSEECARVCLVTQSCPTLCNPVDGSPPGSSVHGVSHIRVLKCIFISFPRESSQPRDWTYVSSVSWIAAGFFTHEPSEKPNEEGTNGVSFSSGRAPTSANHKNFLRTSSPPP